MNQMKNTQFEPMYMYMRNVPNLDTFLGLSLFIKSTINKSTDKWNIDCTNPTIENIKNTGYAFITVVELKLGYMSVKLLMDPKASSNSDDPKQSCFST